MLAVLGLFRVTGIRGLALVRVELLLDYSLRPCLLADGLMLGMELHIAGFTDSDDRDVLDSLDDTKIALGHDYSFPQFVWGGHSCPPPLIWTLLLICNFAVQQFAALPATAQRCTT
jgi:hypothetical protein